MEPQKCWATGRGIQPRGVRVGDLADIQVHTEGAGDGEVTGTLVGPHPSKLRSWTLSDLQGTVTAQLFKSHPHHYNYRLIIETALEYVIIKFKLRLSLTFLLFKIHTKLVNLTISFWSPWDGLKKCLFITHLLCHICEYLRAHCTIPISDGEEEGGTVIDYHLLYFS